MVYFICLLIHCCASNTSTIVNTTGCTHWKKSLQAYSCLHLLWGTKTIVFSHILSNCYRKPDYNKLHSYKPNYDRYNYICDQCSVENQWRRNITNSNSIQKKDKITTSHFVFQQIYYVPSAYLFGLLQYFFSYIVSTRFIREDKSTNYNTNRSVKLLDW